MEAVIHSEQLARQFGEGDTLVNAVNDVTLTVEKGEFTALVGPSGSGKSTLLNLISGLDTPTSGHVSLGGRPIEKMTGGELSDFRRDHIGFIFQAYNLIPVLSAVENVEYILLLQGVPAQEREARSMAILERVGLGDKAHRRPGQLSGGQQQRVAIARAMVSMPDIILADEPTANLDTVTGAELIDMMEELNERESMTFLFSTHDPKIMSKARRLITLRDGKIESDERRDR